MNRPRLDASSQGSATLILYPVLALLSFPTLDHVIAGDGALVYAHDVFDLPRSGVLTDWLAHGLTLWNTHVTAGNALLAQQAISPYATDVWLAFIVGPFAAYAVTAWLMATLAGVSMHLFLRDSLRLPTIASVVGATLYVFCFWHTTYGMSAPAIPLLLWLADRAMATGPRRWRYVLAWPFVGAFVLYQGQSQIIALVALLQLAWLLVSTTPGVLAPRRRVAMWLVEWTAAVALFAPVVLTQLVMLPISQRTIWDLSYLYDARPIAASVDTLRFYSAALLGVPIGGDWGVSPAVYGTYFLGAIGLVLVALGVLTARRDRRAFLLVALLAAIPLIDLVAVLITPLQEQLGLLKSLQLVRVRHLFPFALTAVAALGASALMDAVSRDVRFDRRRLVAIGLVAIPLVITIAATIEGVISRRGDLRMLGTEAVGWALVLTSLAIGVAVLVASVVWIAGRRSAGMPGAVAAIILIATLVGERALYTHGERYIADGELGSWSGSLGPTSAQRFLQEQGNPSFDRVLTFGDHANRMGFIDLFQADGYQAIYPLTYHRFFGALIAPSLATNEALATYFGSWGNRAYAFGPAVDPELIALGGVRWLYVVGDAVPTVPGITQRFRDASVSVYEVPDVLPRAFVVDKLAVKASLADVTSALSTASVGDLRGTAWLVDGEATRSIEAQFATTGTATSSSASIVDYAPDRVEVAVQATGPGMLVLTDAMAPGWIAERDGTPVDIATVDATFRGVPVEATTRSVVFMYRPIFTYVGFAIALAAAGLSIGWAIWTRRMDRR